MDGYYGKLVPVGNVECMADAIRITLKDPPDKSFLKEAVRDYTVETSSRRYLEILLGGLNR